jgi:AraC-like DNA-binding protein
MLWSFKSGFIYFVPWLIYTDIAVAFAIGPLVYFYINILIGNKTPELRRYLLHFIPVASILCIIIMNNIIDTTIISYYYSNRPSYPLYTLRPIVRVIDIISNIYMLSYFIPAVMNVYKLLNNGKQKEMEQLKTILYYMSCILFLSILMLIASATGSSTLAITSIYLLTLAAVWYFIFSFRHPEFTQKAIKEARTIRYESTMLNGIDSAAVLGRLDELMEDDKIYSDYDLTLPKLSTELMITPHQLSRILNSERRINFRSLVNSYRIKESIRQMAEHPDRTILEIALASGFNSKSSFNSVFLKSTGKTPSDYRESLKG